MPTLAVTRARTGLPLQPAQPASPPVVRVFSCAPPRTGCSGRRGLRGRAGSAGRAAPQPLTTTTLTTPPVRRIGCDDCRAAGSVGCGPAGRYRAKRSRRAAGAFQGLASVPGRVSCGSGLRGFCGALARNPPEGEPRGRFRLSGLDRLSRLCYNCDIHLWSELCRL